MRSGDLCATGTSTGRRLSISEIRLDLDETVHNLLSDGAAGFPVVPPVRDDKPRALAFCAEHNAVECYQREVLSVELTQVVARKRCRVRFLKGLLGDYVYAVDFDRRPAISFGRLHVQ